MTKYVLMDKGAYDWRIMGIYDSMEQILRWLQDAYGMPELTLEDIENGDFIYNNEMQIINGKA